jgi:RNA polymerase sigma-70 factor, ECF subfamily
MEVIQQQPELRRDREAGEPDPAALANRWRSGDPGAFREVVDRYQGPLLAYVHSLLGHLQDAEDVVQETLLRAHASIHQLRTPDSLWGWLKRIAHNAAVDTARTSARKGTPTDPSVIREIGECTPAGGSDGADVVLSLEAIVNAIESLPETYRQAAIYHYLQEWPSAKIADTLGIDPAAARQRISRAGKMLRETLGKTRDSEHHDL